MRWDNHIAKPGQDGYPRMQVDGRSKKTHVVMWEKANGEKPKGFDIHHKDLNKENYELENLELLTRIDHRRIHAGWIRENGKWSHKKCCSCKKLLPLSDFSSQGKDKPPRANCKKCVNERWKKIHGLKLANA